MNQVEFGFNWTYVDNRDIAYFSSGRLPIRPASVDLGLPTNGDGDYEWRGFRLAEGPPAGDQPGGRRARQLEQQAGARVRRRRRPLVVRLAPACAASLRRARGHREVLACVRGRRDEHGRDAGLPRAQGAARRSRRCSPGRPRRARATSRCSTCSRAGARRAEAGSTSTSTARSTTRARRSWTPPGRRIARRGPEPGRSGPRCPTSRPSSRSTTRPTTRAPPTTTAGTATSTRISAR